MKKYRFLYITILALILSGIVHEVNDSTQALREGLSVQTFYSQSGWGYSVVMDGNIIIKQPFIPAITGEKPFKSKNQAQRTAQLVINKIRSGKTPAISRRELDSLQIRWK